MAVYKTILIAGPTASGKSGLAMDLAKRQHGVIINTDSMQVYRDLHLITARPSDADEVAVQHQLYGHVDGSDTFSAGAWLRSVQALIPDLRGEFETLIFVGGTGLYFNALTLGLSEIPETPAATRADIRNALAECGPLQLHTQLKAIDAVSAAALEPSDGQRIVRALEVVTHTGRSLSDWQKDKSIPLIDVGLPETKAIVVDPDRNVLIEKIEQRFKAMLEQGGLDEVSALIERKLDPQLPLMKAIGVAELSSFLAGHITLDAAINLAVIASRQYAKRQRTWFRGQMGDEWVRFAHTQTAFDAI